MRLSALLPDFERAAADPQITGFAIDHRKIISGHVFGAFKGARFNGENYIAAAVAAGAVAVVARPEAKVEGALHIASDNPRRTFAHLAMRYFALSLRLHRKICGCRVLPWR